MKLLDLFEKHKHRFTGENGFFYQSKNCYFVITNKEPTRDSRGFQAHKSSMSNLYASYNNKIAIDAKTRYLEIENGIVINIVDLDEQPNKKDDINEHNRHKESLLIARKSQELKRLLDTKSSRYDYEQAEILDNICQGLAGITSGYFSDTEIWEGIKNCADLAIHSINENEK